MAANTYKRHLTSLKLFREFLTATRGISDIEIKALDAQLMEEYQYYLMTVRSNNNNTTVKYLRNLSKVVNLAKTSIYLNVQTKSDLILGHFLYVS